MKVKKRQFDIVFQKDKCVFFLLGNPLLRIYPTDIRSHIKGEICMRSFVEAWFVRANDC